MILLEEKNNWIKIVKLDVSDPYTVSELTANSGVIKTNKSLGEF